jgi:hypothetical protein
MSISIHQLSDGENKPNEYLSDADFTRSFLDGSSGFVTKCYAGIIETDLLYFGPAHTNGDIVVYIPAEKAAIGRVWWRLFIEN